MNIRESISKFGFAFTLLGLSFNSLQRVYDYTLAGTVALFGLIILLERVSSNKIWLKITDGAKYLDVTNIAFGFGVINFSTKLLSNSFTWLGLFVLAAGMIFVCLGIGQLLGKSGSTLLKRNAIFAICIGFVTATAGIVWIIINRNTITFQNLDIPIVVIGYGIILLYFGWKRFKTKFTMVDYLEQLNRKERFFLIGLALGNPKFKLDESFLKKLNNEFHTDIKGRTFVAMDYHLNWIFAAAELAVGTPVHDNIYDNKDKVIDGTQTDVDLLIAYEDNGGFTNLVMLEAKGVTSYDNVQFRHKIDRFTKIFGENGNRFEKVKPYFGLISPKEPKNLDVDYCPSWLKVDGRIPWFEMDMSDRLVVFGCDRQGNSNEKREFWTVKLK